MDRINEEVGNVNGRYKMVKKVDRIIPWTDSKLDIVEIECNDIKIICRPMCVCDYKKVIALIPVVSRCTDVYTDDNVYNILNLPTFFAWVCYRKKSGYDRTSEIINDEDNNNINTILIANVDCSESKNDKSITEGKDGTCREQEKKKAFNDDNKIQDDNEDKISNEAKLKKTMEKQVMCSTYTHLYYHGDCKNTNDDEDGGQKCIDHNDNGNNDELVGYAELYRLPHLGRLFDARLERVVVSPAYQGKGIATKLCQHIINEAKNKLRCGRIDLTVEKDNAKHIYENKLGFRKIDTTCMRLMLQPL